MVVVDEVDEQPNEEDALFDADFQEVKSRKKESGRDGSKPERRQDRRRSKGKDSKESSHAPAPATSTTGPQPLMSQG